MKASVVERFNRTLKENIWKKFTLKGNYKWCPLLQIVVSEYNNTTHSTIHAKPVQADEIMAQKLLKTVYNDN